MPIIEVHMLEGRTIRQKRELIAGLTEAAMRALGVQASQVRILIDELDHEHFAVSGESVAQVREQQTATVGLKSISEG